MYAKVPNMFALLLLCFTSFSLGAENSGVVGFSPASPLFDRTLDMSLEPRAISQSCFTSVVNKLSPPLPTNSAFSRWATASLVMPTCTVTAPASFSSDYMSYDKVLSTWLGTIKSAAGNIKTDCGADRFSLTFSGYCSSSRTVYFTSAQQTQTATLPKMDKPDTIYITGAGHALQVSYLLAIGTTLLALVL
ncbi:unnamed protein product [Clonostachys solani]|uniref:Uncharacterized protein n=1 Tax=Clonostachys solani TaxID=160281 RepID=A0A9N9Z287_9HYPO|nr:unnamed protein product [Clonostachys solani]